jgi:hypothetical protein
MLHPAQRRHRVGVQPRRKSIHMISNAARYRRYAARCIQLAQELDLPADRARALDMAEQWRRLADHAETIDNRLAAVARAEAKREPSDQFGPGPSDPPPSSG